MPGITSVFWLYGYASHLLLVKALVAWKGRTDDQHTAIILSVVWNLTKLLWAGVDLLYEWRREKRHKSARRRSITSIQSANIYVSAPQDPYLAPSSSPAAFGAPNMPPETMFDDRREDLIRDMTRSNSPFHDLHISSNTTDRFKSGENLDNKAVAKRTIVAKALQLIWRGTTKMSSQVTVNSSFADIFEDPMTSLESEGSGLSQSRYWWFIWLMSGWLEMVAIIVSYKALEKTFVSKCQAHRNWAIVFIALMQMLFEDETLVHSVIGVALVIVGLLSSIIVGVVHETEVEMGTFVETRSGCLIAVLAGILFSFQMFIHELLLDLIPKSARVSLLWESLGSIYLVIGLVPMLQQFGVADIVVGMQNLRENYLMLLWFVANCIIAIGSNLYNRKRSSPFARSVAFILQLPIVYVTEVFVIRWRKPQWIDCFTVTCFLFGFLLSTACMPFSWFGSWFNDLMFSTAFYKPMNTSKFGNFFREFEPGLCRVKGDEVTPPPEDEPSMLFPETSPTALWETFKDGKKYSDDTSEHQRRNSLADYTTPKRAQ